MKNFKTIRSAKSKVTQEPKNISVIPQKRNLPYLDTDSIPDNMIPPKPKKLIPKPEPETNDATNSDQEPVTNQGLGDIEEPKPATNPGQKIIKPHLNKFRNKLKNLINPKKEEDEVV